MLTLEAYLDGEYRVTAEDIRALEATLQQTVRTFESTFWHTPGVAGGYWDYEQRLDETPLERIGLRTVDDVSHGTVAMVAAAVGKLIDHCSLHDSGTAHLRLDSSTLEKYWIAAVQTLVVSITNRGLVYSGSFGTNDPITLNHIIELLRSTSFGQRLELKSIEAKQALESLTGLITANRIRESVCRSVSQSPIQNVNMLPGLGSDKEYLKGAFAPVRVVRNFRVLQELPEYAGISLHRDYELFFEGSLHDQLSYSSILDSRFDPAELMFSLEGMLLCRDQLVDADLLARIMEVLQQKQQESAHWRPSQPVYATSRGETMVPISVEGANSLLRSFSLVSKRKDFACFAETCTAMMRRFWHWLRARSVQVDPYFGWHSDHLNDLNLIHVWVTSQVVEFMLDYRALLQRHVAEQTLSLSRVKVEEPVPLRIQLNLEHDPDWTKVVEVREPVRTLGRNYRIFERIGDDFVRSWISRNPENFSMLLYGPPGTGKTALARLVAGALDFPLISLSVSDFLGSGGTRIEARAKAIFQMLGLQSNSVSLYDEIDSFLLDRDSVHYRAQDTVFQFLTPGMLTKIHDLRDAGKSIFIIATNYETRIDPAIKRSGRVDRKYLLLPPDKERRIEMASRGAAVEDGTSSEIAKHSLYLGFTEIKSACSKAKRDGRPVAEQLSRAERSTGGEFYGRRAYIDDPFPVEEAACLYLLADEVGLVSNHDPKGFREHFHSGVQRSAIGEKKDPPAEAQEARLWGKIEERAAEIKAAREADC